MKSTKITISELLQLIYIQIESNEERYKYKNEVKKLYQLCKKSLFCKIKELFVILFASKFSAVVFLMKRHNERASKNDI